MGMSPAKIVYIAIIALILLPFKSWIGWQIDAPIALLLGFSRLPSSVLVSI